MDLYSELPVSAFGIADAELLQLRELLKRTDTKFVVTRSDLASILTRVKEAYAILPAGSSLIAKYETQYFDTDRFDTFREHCRGRRPRHKVRIRNYCDRDLKMLEVKMKTNAERTVKWRSPVMLSEVLNPEGRRFIATHYPKSAQVLTPSAQTNFRRITLLGIRSNERVTIDLNLEFRRKERVAAPTELVIIEVKQERFGARTPIMLALREQGIREASISKYCAAIALLERSRGHRYLHKMRKLKVSYA